MPPPPAGSEQQGGRGEGDGGHEQRGARLRRQDEPAAQEQRDDGGSSSPSTQCDDRRGRDPQGHDLAEHILVHVQATPHAIPRCNADRGPPQHSEYASQRGGGGRGGDELTLGAGRKTRGERDPEGAGTEQRRGPQQRRPRLVRPQGRHKRQGDRRPEEPGRTDTRRGGPQVGGKKQSGRREDRQQQGARHRQAGQELRVPAERPVRHRVEDDRSG